MALINCPACGKQISDKSEKCIHCGNLLSENTENNEQSSHPENDKKDLITIIKDFKKENKFYKIVNTAIAAAIIILAIFALTIGLAMCTIPQYMESLAENANRTGDKEAYESAMNEISDVFSSGSIFRIIAFGLSLLPYIDWFLALQIVFIVVMAAISVISSNKIKNMIIFLKNKNKEYDYGKTTSELKRDFENEKLKVLRQYDTTPHIAAWPIVLYNKSKKYIWLFVAEAINKCVLLITSVVLFVRLVLVMSDSFSTSLNVQTELIKTFFITIFGIIALYIVTAIISKIIAFIYKKLKQSFIKKHLN